jgi:hypothetical protein
MASHAQGVLVPLVDRMDATTSYLGEREEGTEPPVAEPLGAPGNPVPDGDVGRNGDVHEATASIRATAIPALARMTVRGSPSCPMVGWTTTPSIQFPDTVARFGGSLQDSRESVGYVSWVRSRPAPDNLSAPQEGQVISSSVASRSFVIQTCWASSATAMGPRPVTAVATTRLMSGSIRLSVSLE